MTEGRKSQQISKDPKMHDCKIEGISASEYIRGVKNGNIQPTYDNAIRAILWAADELAKPTYFLGNHIDDTKDKFKLHYPKEPGSLGRDTP